MCKIDRVLEPLASDLVECKCLRNLVLFLEQRKVLKNADRKYFMGINTDQEMVERLLSVMKKKDDAALKAVEDFLMSDDHYANLRAKFAESWINEKKRRQTVKRALGDSLLFLCSVQPA